MVSTSVRPCAGAARPHELRSLDSGHLLRRLSRASPRCAARKERCTTLPKCRLRILRG